MNVAAAAGAAFTRMRDQVPPGTAEALRTASRAVGVVTAQARLMPDFLVVGAQRCGTTTLYGLLREHPAVVRPLWHKGIAYFDLNHHRGSRWYQAHFPLRALAQLRTGAHKPRTFESTGYYMYHPLAPSRIAAELPGVRLIAMLRNPVERAFSAWKHEHARGFEDASFEHALDLEDERLAGEEDRMRADSTYQSFHHRHHAYVERGLYARQIVALQAAVGKDRVRVVDANRFFEDPHEEFGALQDWLGLPYWRPKHVGQLNARPSAPLDPRLQQRLLTRFEAEDLALAGLLGQEPSWRA